MVGMAELANLLVFALVTKYFSGCLVFTLLRFRFSGNISLVFSCFVHFSANLLLRIDLLDLSVGR